MDLSDYEGVLNIVRAAGEARDDGEFARTVVSDLAMLVPAEQVVLNVLDFVSGETLTIGEPASFVVPPELEPLLVELADQHPLITDYRTTSDGSAKKISDFITQEEFHSRELYKSYYRPLGVEYQMAFTLSGTYPDLVAIVLSKSGSDFTERDRSVLNLLRPHLVQTWFSVKEHSRLRSLLSSASDATAESGAGVIVLSDPPQELAPGALMMLYRFYGRPTKSAPVSARVQRWIAQQQTRLDTPIELQLRKPLRAELDGRRMVLRYLPGRSPFPAALLLREERRQLPQRRLESLGLTAREREIVSHVVKGDSNIVIGHALHVAPTTVKKHLDNIYEKVGVRGRGRLTAFVLDILES